CVARRLNSSLVRSSTSRDLRTEANGGSRGVLNAAFPNILPRVWGTGVQLSSGLSGGKPPAGTLASPAPDVLEPVADRVFAPSSIARARARSRCAPRRPTPLFGTARRDPALQPGLRLLQRVRRCFEARPARRAQRAHRSPGGARHLGRDPDR